MENVDSLKKSFRRTCGIFKRTIRVRGKKIFPLRLQFRRAQNQTSVKKKTVRFQKKHGLPTPLARSDADTFGKRSFAVLPQFFSRNVHPHCPKLKPTRAFNNILKTIFGCSSQQNCLRPVKVGNPMEKQSPRFPRRNEKRRFASAPFWKNCLAHVRAKSRGGVFSDSPAVSEELPQEDDLPKELRGVVFCAEEIEADDEILRTAKQYFHVQHLMPWQRLVIGNILDAAADLQSGSAQRFMEESHDADSTDVFCLGRQIVLLPTGAGKSLCFLLPAVLLPGPTLIFYPLLALMSDQARRIEESGIECVVFRGGQSEEEREENFRRIQNGAKLILANPEVLQNGTLLAKLRECNISHIAIDEAHCVAEWGDTFRPAYLTLGKIIQDLRVNLVTAFTATASPHVLERIGYVLFGGSAHVVRGESDRLNIRYFVEYAWAKQKAVCRLAATEEKPMLVFCPTRAAAEEMARELAECIGRDTVRFYHAGLSREEKTVVEQWFFPKNDAILCCTCAFGMGVDKSNIRTVVHLEASPTAESYVQETGRAGRDKKISKAILLWNFGDSERLKTVPAESRERVIQKFAESKKCRRQVLLDALGGEQAICSGCDICEGRKKDEHFSPPTVFDAADAKYVFKFIKKNQGYYNKNETLAFMKRAFNENDRALFGMNVWTTGDVEAIVEQLQKSGAVYAAGFFPVHKLAAAKQQNAPRCKVRHIAPL